MFDSLAPGFLIASPPLGDPNFDRTVVLLALHSEDGALGFVVNRAAPVGLSDLLRQAGYDDVREDDSPVWVGGPVQPHSGWVVVDDPSIEPGDGIIGVGKRLRVSSSRNAFNRVARALRGGDGAHAKVGTGAEDTPRTMVLLGYSGWAPEQLESEIARGAWLPVPLDEGILFDVAPESRWERAYGLMGLTPSHMMTMRTVGQA